MAHIMPDGDPMRNSAGFANAIISPRAQGSVVKQDSHVPEACLPPGVHSMYGGESRAGRVSTHSLIAIDIDYITLPSSSTSAADAIEGMLDVETAEVVVVMTGAVLLPLRFGGGMVNHPVKLPAPITVVCLG